MRNQTTTTTSCWFAGARASSNPESFTDCEQCLPSTSQPEFQDLMTHGTAGAVAIHDNSATAVPFEVATPSRPIWERLNAAGYGKNRGEGSPVACLDGHRPHPVQCMLTLAPYFVAYSAVFTLYCCRAYLLAITDEPVLSWQTCNSWQPVTHIVLLL